MESARGQLLIAGPTLLDPNFWRTVVLVVEHTDEGAFGLVLNRPSETTVGEAVPAARRARRSRRAAVHRRSGSALGGDRAGRVRGPGRRRAAGVRRRRRARRPGPRLRRSVAARARRTPFVGHAGWGPGQLDAELERGDWILEPARREDAFSAEPRELWSSVLTRKGGSYALVARMPPDPSVN